MWLPAPLFLHLQKAGFLMTRLNHLKCSKFLDMEDIAVVSLNLVTVERCRLLTLLLEVQSDQGYSVCL